MTGKVALEGLEFHAYHGIYSHERTTGNKFEVDIEVDTRFSKAAFEDDISGTLDYEALYNLVQEEMDKPSKLLETVANLIAQRTLEIFPEAIAVMVRISKFNPPIGGVCRKAYITVSKNREADL